MLHVIKDVDLSVDQINTVQNGRHFADVIFKRIFLKEEIYSEPGFT